MVWIYVLCCCSLRHLSDWFRQLATHPSLVDELYRPTAFMAATGHVTYMLSQSQLVFVIYVLHKNDPLCRIYCTT